MTYPTAIRHRSGFAWAIDYFATEADADAAGAIVAKRGDKAYGGWYDGMLLGRDKAFDHVDKATGEKLFAVTRQ